MAIEYGSKGALEVVPRLDYGTKGTEVEVLTNHVRLAIGNDVPGREKDERDEFWWKNATIYIYHVDFIGNSSQGARGSSKHAPSLSKPKKYELLNTLFEEEETLNKYQDRIAFNGEDTLYSRVPLEEFTLFGGCWKVSKKKRNLSSPSKRAERGSIDDLVSQIKLQFASKITLNDIYKATLSKDPEEQMNKMSGINKTALLSLLGAKFMCTNDPIYQLHGNKFFIFNENTKTIPFQIGGYLMCGFSVSLVFASGSVLLNTINVALPFYKHTKYLPGDPNFRNESETKYTLMDWLIECYLMANSGRGVRCRKKPSSNDLNTFILKNREVQSLLKGLKVYRYYLNYSVRSDGTSKPPKKMQVKAVVDVARETPDSLKFKILPSGMTKEARPVPGEKEITVSTTAYFSKKYNIKLKYPDVKMVSLGGKNIIPAECLTIVPGQKLKGKVYDEKTMMDFMATRPAEKFNLISNLALPSLDKALKSEDQKTTENATLPLQFMKVPSRIIDAPVIHYKDSEVTFVNKRLGAFKKNSKTPNEESKGNWNLMNHNFVSTSTETYTLRPVFINDTLKPPPASILEQLTTSVNKFAVDAGSIGVNFDVSGHPILINSFNAPMKKMVGRDGNSPRGRGRGRGRASRGVGGNHASFLYEIAAGEEKLVNLLAKIPPMSYVLFVLSHGNDSAIYNRLKEIADLRFGVLNSCVVWDSFKKNSSRYNMNAAMKMNLKLNGTNHSLGFKDLELLTDNTTGLPFLVIAADVTHYPGKDQNSIAAMVGSYERTFSKFPGDYIMQDKPGQEIIAKIGDLLVSRLELYRIHNDGKLPTKILFYRDGVSESQLSQVVQIEVKEIKKALRRYGSDHNGGKKYNPPVTCIVVAKRNHVRFMPLHENAKNLQGETVAVQSMGNVMPGTVVDREITSPAHFDFFLQSQQAFAGTGVPCHYWCIYNENHFNSDYLQTVSHALCYIFGRSSTSVKVVSPVYYADLLCTRAAQYFKANFEILNAEFQKNKKTKEDVLPVSKLLPPIHKNIQAVMYYI